MTRPQRPFAVTVRVVIEKTYHIQARSDDEAVTTAHKIFSILAEDGVAEEFDQDIVSADEMSEEEANTITHWVFAPEIP